MTTLVQRRRGVTYGKPHRRALNAVDLHGDAESTVSGELNRYEPKHSNTEPDTPPHRVSQRDEPRLSRPLPEEALGQERNASTYSHSIYEFMSSEDEISVEHQQSQPKVAAKKRKLAHDSDVQETLPLSRSSASPKGAASRSNSKARRPHRTTKHGTDRTAQASSDLNSSAREQVRQGLSRQNRRTVKPDVAAKVLDGKFPSHPATVNATGSEGSYGRSTTSERQRFHSNLCDVATPSAAQDFRSRSPVTPPRSVSPSNEACMTPRQRELWHRLLTPNRSSRSPSRLAMSVLEIDTSDEDATRGTRAPRHRHQHNARAEPTRTNRLIDSLFAFEHDKSVSSGDPRHKEVFLPSSNSMDVSTSHSSEKSLASKLHSGSVEVDNFGHQNNIITEEPDNNHRSLYAPRGAKVTYAQQRSYMTDHLPIQDMALHMDLIRVDQPPPTTEVRPSDPNVDDYDIIPEADGQANSMKSARELREAGGNVRLLSELEAVLDEIDGNYRSITALRSSLLKLASRILEPVVARLFAEKGLESRFLRSPIPDDDNIAASLKAICILLLLEHSNCSALMTLGDEDLIKTFLVELLACATDLKTEIEAATPKISHGTRQEFCRICDLVLSLKLWQPLTPPSISSQLLGLQSLQQISKGRHGNGLQELLSQEDIKVVAQTSFPDDLISAQTQPAQIYCIGLAITLIEKSMLHASFQDKDSINEDVLSRVTCILPYLRSFNGAPLALENVTLHFYSNLTQMKPGICDTFARSRATLAMLDIVDTFFQSVIVPKPPHNHADLSRVILALASLINIAAASSTLCRRTLDPVSGDQPILDTLISVFLRMRRRVTEVYSEDEIDINVAFGYLSVLISCLCLDPTTRAHGRERLPDQSLDTVLDAVREFLKYHRAIDAMSSEDSYTSGQSSFADRVQDVLKRLTM